MPQKNKEKSKLSIIIPVFNEIRYLKIFINNLTKVFNKENIEYIFVNDGSNDGSEIFLKNEIKKFSKNKTKLINLKKNYGKGFAVKEGLKLSTGDYILFHDSDLELSPKDTNEMYQLIKENPNMKVLFGSRYISGKLRASKNFLNEIVSKFNSYLFNILFRQSISDVHCGAKIVSKDILKKINLTANDFGFEIDIASQIAKNNFKIYEYGISYFSRTKEEGKKITWKDGLLSYYYLFKFRFLINDYAILLSILYSVLYMAFVGSYFGLGIGKILFILIFIIIGSFIGLYKKLASSSIILLMIYFGSLFSKGNGKYFTVFLGFFLGLILAKIFENIIKKLSKNNFIRFFV